MIIIPSYNEDGILNYFVSRAFYDSNYKHKNPNVSKDIIGFDMIINWEKDFEFVRDIKFIKDEEEYLQTIFK